MQLPPELTFTTSTIADGNMSMRFGKKTAVVTARDRFVGHLNYVCMQCDHGDTIQFVSEPQANQTPAEVLIAQTPGLTLMLLTADCLPTALYDPTTKTIALAHHSRQTIAAGLPTETVRFLQRERGVDPARLQVYVGPHIHPASYCFNNTEERFADRIEPFTTRTDTSVCVDLPAAHTAQLGAAGVPATQIQYSAVDTFSSADHFSHFESTRDDRKPHGRLATILTLHQ